MLGTPLARYPYCILLLGSRNVFIAVVLSIYCVSASIVVSVEERAILIVGKSLNIE